MSTLFRCDVTRYTSSGWATDPTWHTTEAEAEHHGEWQRTIWAPKRVDYVVWECDDPAETGPGATEPAPGAPQTLTAGSVVAAEAGNSAAGSAA